MARAKVPSRAESRVEKGEQIGESTHPPLRTLEFLAQQSFNIKGRVIIALPFFVQFDHELSTSYD